ncbi:Putative protein [Zobellia galactanivorans]|uniref:Uncharacterized protein n=1 Tax=Zobellia galactanivorans (strain DSM 12802 / CCUG 47099 / CIP 106680 / NCIMB 13871 / Dsij) TaxID=63186 RepID=G0L2D1_ZOBGA|nr:Putative protein [Zobellia galactanivorans]
MFICKRFRTYIEVYNYTYTFLFGYKSNIFNHLNPHEYKNSYNSGLTEKRNPIKMKWFCIREKRDCSWCS